MLAFTAAAAPPLYVWNRDALPQAQAAVEIAPDFAGQEVSDDARRLVGWVLRSNDHARTNFIVIDKKHARIHVFDSMASMSASGPILLGGMPGDEAIPAIGSRPLAQVRPEERITPAGRFVAERGQNDRAEDVVWISYDDALSIHRVLTTNADERRLERLATPTPDDNRISYGCINVPVDFYEAHVRPAFATHRAAVYILPEVKTLESVFGLPSTHAYAHSSKPGVTP